MAGQAPAMAVASIDDSDETERTERDTKQRGGGSDRAMHELSRFDFVGSELMPGVESSLTSLGITIRYFAASVAARFWQNI